MSSRSLSYHHQGSHYVHATDGKTHRGMRGYRLARTLHSVPVRKPLEGEIDLASGFGVRQDPFTGAPAMHTGLDIHGEPGDPVRASADGTVTAAGWSGGYGRVVDVDHGNGLSTRYSTSSTCTASLPNAFCASAASMN
jgi:murein DD-endopeptidase MepM/ murein hydrolase activator NlpD